jgi:Xaa-Pro aminopeptidase
MKMLGAEKPAFDTIVASGYRSALPHGVASEKKIAKGDFVTFDFGAWYKGYVADITRTVVMGKATVRQKKIYNTVLRANQAAIRKVKSGVSGFDVDKAARSVIKRAGYSKYFGHGTGHGIGIYVHVGPNAGPRSKDILKRGMVVTIEPGIYIPKWGGVRIEDDVLVTNTGSRVLTSAPKKLLEL